MKMKIRKWISMLCSAVIIISCNNNPETATQSSTTQDSKGIATSTFKVWGNCEMCKETIEKSLEVEGVVKANWDVDSKIMTVHYDSQKVSLDEIQKNISLAGYDNEKYKGDDKAYSALPECCQ